MKFGACFFGWLTATGMAIVLTALAAAAGTAVGLATNTDVGEATDTASAQADTVGIVGGIVLLVIGFKTWAKVNRSTAILVVVVPHVAVYGLWLVYGMSKLA